MRAGHPVAPEKGGYAAGTSRRPLPADGRRPGFAGQRGVRARFDVERDRSIYAPGVSPMTSAEIAIAVCAVIAFGGLIAIAISAEETALPRFGLAMLGAFAFWVAVLMICVWLFR